MRAAPASRLPLVSGQVAALVAAAFVVGGCGPVASGSDGGLADGGSAGEPFAVEVVRFEPGEMAGYGQEGLPGVVLGPPRGDGYEWGNTDSVLSLGLGGVIELRLGVPVVDGEGPDLLVFENAFACGAGRVNAEPGEVAVSDDGETWHTFPCSPAGPGDCVVEAVTGCAGYGPVFAHAERNDVSPTDPYEAGGDRFDLAELGVERARFVRITDRNAPGGLQAEPKAGFDLDAVAVANAAD